MSKISKLDWCELVQEQYMIAFELGWPQTYTRQGRCTARPARLEALMRLSKFDLVLLYETLVDRNSGSTAWRTDRRF